MKSDFKYWITIPTRFRDLDTMNHVNSAMYLTYFEMARMDYFHSVGLLKLKEPGRRGPAVVTQTCNYKQQLFHPSIIEAGIRCSRIDTTSFTVEYEFYLKDSETLICDGTTTMTWVDYTIPKAIPVPDVLREAINELEGREV
ncbi:MAG TPA: acyl-CoA thioesterase [Candidatus Hydrogenedentes bacterium]|nr:acyl-CoA thioesterase [Candidatus Hydrogenedentota bacterium]